MAASVTVYVNINEGGVTAKLNEIDALIDKLNAKKVNINVQTAGQTITNLGNVANGFTGVGSAATAAGTAVQGYGQLVKKSSEEVNGSTSKTVSTYKNGVNQMITVTEKGDDVIVKTTTDFEAMGKAAAKAEKDQQKLLKEQFAANEKRLKQEEVVSKAEEASAKKSSALWTGLKASAIAAGTAFLIKNTKEALNTMKDVDSELANIRKVTGESAESINRLGKEAYDTASKYGVSATEYLKGAADFAKAGYSNYANLAELAIKTQLVGDVSAETASKFLLSADAAYKFGGNVDQLSTVLDRANVIENNYATSIDKLAEGFPIVASTASMANMSVDELMAALGTITATTQETGRKAATALRALILNIEGEIGTVIDEDMTITQESVESMSDALKKYGNEAVKAAQKTGKLIDPMEAIKSLAEAYKNGDLDDQGLFDILSSLGGKLRTNQLTALIKNFDMYSDMLEKVKVSAGSADAEIGIMQETWERRTEKLKNSWTDLVSDIVDTDAVKGGLDVITSAINGLDKAIEALTTTQQEKAEKSLKSLSQQYENLYGEKGSAIQEIEYLRTKQGELSSYEQNRLAYLTDYEAQLSKAVKEATDRDIEQRQKYLEEQVSNSNNLIDVIFNSRSRLSTALEGLTSDKASVYNEGEAGSKTWQDTANGLSEVITKYADMYTYISDLKAEGGQLSEDAARFMLIYEEAVREYTEAASNAAEETENLNGATQDSADGFDDVAKSADSAAEALKRYSEATAGGGKESEAGGYRSAYQKFLDDWKSGKTGSINVEAAADLFIPDEVQRSLGYNMQAMGELLASDLYQGIYNGASGDAGVDFANYIADNMNAELAKIAKITENANGTFNFQYASMQKLADYFNLPLPAIQALIGALDNYGVEVEMGWEDTENLANALGLMGDNAGNADTSLAGIAASLKEMGYNRQEVSSIIQSLGDLGYLDLSDIELPDIGAAIAQAFGDIQLPDMSALEQYKQLVDELGEGATSEVTVTITGVEDVSSLKDSIEQLPETTEVSVTETGAIQATTDVSGLQAVIDLIPEGKNAEITANVVGTEQAAALQGIIDSINSKEVTITANIITNGTVPKFAEGTKDAPGGPALVNEKGPELISDNGRAYIANGGKPAIVSLGKGAIVLTAEETRQAIGNISVNNGINAYASGIPRISSGSGGGGGGSTGTEREKATRTTSTAKEKDPWKELESELKDALSDYNDIAEWYHNQKKHDEEADVYLDAIAKINEARDKYLAAGFKEDSAEVARLANKIYDYQEKIREAHQHAIDDLEEELDLIDEQIDLAENQGDYQKALELQGLAQDKVAKLLEEYRAAGYSDTSEEILKLANKGYGYASKSDSQIKDLWKDLIDSLKAMQSTQEDANDLAEKQLAVDEAREALTNAQNQRTVRVFNPITGQWEWIANAKDIASAEEQLQKAEESLLKEQQSQELDALKKLYEQNGNLSDFTIGPGLSALIGNASIDDMNAFATALGLLSGGLTTTADTSAKSIFDSVDSHDTVTQYTFNGVTIDAGTAQNTSLADLVAMISPLAITTNMPA